MTEEAAKTRRFEGHAPRGASSEALAATFHGKNIVFYIEKSQNHNCVVYEANIVDGKLDEKEPIKPYWILYARDPIKEEGLNMIERNTAYGHSAKKHPSKEGHFVVNLVSLKKMEVEVFIDENGTLHAQMEENGEIVEVLSIFVQMKSSWGMPKVDYIDMKLRKLDGEVIPKRIQNK